MSADTGHVAASPLCCRRLRTETRRAAACGARESRVGVRGDWLATSRIPDGDRARGGVWRKKIKGRRPRTLAGDVADSGRRQGARRLVAEKTSDTCRGDTGAAAARGCRARAQARKKEGRIGGRTPFRLWECSHFGRRCRRSVPSDQARLGALSQRLPTWVLLLRFPDAGSQLKRLCVGFLPPSEYLRSGAFAAVATRNAMISVGPARC